MMTTTTAATVAPSTVVTLTGGNGGDLTVDTPIIDGDVEDDERRGRATKLDCDIISRRQIARPIITRPAAAPAYYLGRPAAVWQAALRQPLRAGPQPLGATSP